MDLLLINVIRKGERTGKGRSNKFTAGIFILFYFLFVLFLCADGQYPVFNKNIDTWGLKPDSTKDAYRFDIPVTTTDNHIEFFTMVFEKAAPGANLIMAWDNVEARLPLNF